MLSDKIKATIRQSYKAIGESLENFTPRKQQTLLIAEIAKTLSGEYSKDRKIITIEAGTGTGKSLAYSLGAIPLGLVRKKKVCISTATVALQEQLVDKDLPFLAKHSRLDFNYTLVKGRQRYVCRQKLAMACLEEDEPQAGFTFAEKPKSEDIAQLKAMFSALKDGSWLGDIDSWSAPISHQIWQQVQCDKHSCLKHLEEHKNCPFHTARESMLLADVLVINHSLLLADLDLGGGKILPEPDDCFYIIDEAHHLPKVTRDHASASIAVKGSLDWLSKIEACGDNIAKLVDKRATNDASFKLADYVRDILTDMNKVNDFTLQNSTTYFANETTYRFENGIVPKTIKHWAEDLAQASNKALTMLNKLYTAMMEAVKEGDIKPYLAESLLAESGFFIQRLENFNALWQMYDKVDSEKGAPLARWLEQTKGKKIDVIISASPIEVGFTLEDNLWSKCEGAVLCSATLRALNSFDHFRRQAGLQQNDGSQFLHVDSPFNYQENAVLHVPNMENEPSSDLFTNELCQKLPTLLKGETASLVLFSSYWQMEQVATALRKKHQLSLSVQGEHSRQFIIDLHKNRVEKGLPSIIFGTQSFSEGLDLPGKLLTNLIITKLPFAVPTSPVEEAHAEYISAKGGNPFMAISVPETSKKLIQSCGRLLRNEKDSGKITLLDRRVVTKRYGKELLASLPPFKRQIDY